MKVLGVTRLNFGDTHASFENAADTIPSPYNLAFGQYTDGATYLVIGYNLGNYAAFIAFSYDGYEPKKLCYKFGGTWTWV